MLNIDAELSWICDRYRDLFGALAPRYDHLWVELARPILALIAQGDAPYHTLHQTLQGVRVGQALLEGKQYYEGDVSPRQWLQVLISLVCRDIGYVKNVLGWDHPEADLYFDGQNSWVEIAPAATGAALENCHIERSKAFVELCLNHPELDLTKVKWNIEMTRFPVPPEVSYQDSWSDGGLCRAADLLGQLSDRQFLKTLPALFREWAETNLHLAFGYTSAAELQANYPQFWGHVVQPYIQPGLRYLVATPVGRQYLAQLYTNRCLAHRPRTPEETTDAHLQHLKDESGLLPWQEAGFTFT